MIRSDAGLDKKLRGALKACATAGATGSGAEREKSSKLIEAVISSKSDENFQDHVNLLSNYFLKRKRMAEIGQPLAPPVGSILDLGCHGFSETVDFIFQESAKELKNLPTEQLLSGGFPEKVLKAVAKARKDLLGAALAHFLERPEAADASQAADWMLSAAKPKALMPLLPLLLSKRERLPHLKTYSTLAQGVFQKDKSGTLLKQALAAVASGKLESPPLERIICSNPALVVQFAQLVPKLLAGPGAEPAAIVFGSVLQSLPRCPKDDREKVSVALASVASAIVLQKKRNPAAERISTGLTGAFFDMLGTSKEEKKGFWVFCQAEQVQRVAEAASANHSITQRGAEFVVDALEETMVSGSNQESVAALAFNLGLRPIGVAGEETKFDPKRHEDTCGGLFRDDGVVVVKPGWGLSGEVIARAKVKGLDAQ